MNIPLRYIKFLTISCVLLMAVGKVSGQGGTVYFDVLLNHDLVHNFEAITSNVVSQPHHGSTSINNTGTNHTLVYTPNANFSGRDTFTVSLMWTFDPGVPVPQTVYRKYIVNVASSHTYAQNDYATTLMDQAKIIPVLDNDSTTFGALTISDIAIVNNGTALINGNNILFNPEPGFHGIAHFNYTVCNDLGACDIGTVSINVFEVPLPPLDSTFIITSKNTSVSFILPEGFTIYNPPAHGIVTPITDVAFEYKPNTGYVGFDNFMFAQNVYGITVFHSVKAHVLNAPDVNVYAKDDYGYTSINTPVTINVQANDLVSINVNNVSVSANGTTQLNADNTVTFTPAPNFTGVATFTYHIQQPSLGISETAKVYVLVSNQNPAEEVYNMTTLENTPLVLNYNVPITNYSFAITVDGQNGHAQFYPGNQTVLINGQQITGSNMIIYTPNDGVSGITDKFEMEYCVNGSCQSVKVYVDILSAGSNTTCLDDCVWPGDANYDGVVDMKDLLPLGWCMGETGYPRADGLQWFGQYGQNWPDVVPTTVNTKHMDTDGDGIIAATDTTAISQFYGRTHAITSGAPGFATNLPLYFVNTTPNPQPGDMVEVDVYLGTTTHPAINAYGLTFTIPYQQALIQDGSLSLEFLNDSWMSQTSPTLGLAKMPVAGRLDAGFTRTSGLAASGYGKIAKLRFIVIEDIDGFRLEKPEIALSSGNASVMDGNGNFVALNSQGLVIPVNLNKQQDLDLNENQLVVYPNPAKDIVNMYLNGNNEIREICLYDLTGRVLTQQSNVSSRQAQINAGVFGPGVYLLEVMTEKGRITKKVQVVK